MRHEPADAVVCIGEPGINALATVRALGRRGVRVHALSLEGSAEIASASRYCSSTSKVAGLDALGDALLRLPVKCAGRALLYIDNDRMLRTLQPRATELRRRFRVVEPLADAQRLMDKSFQIELAAQAGIAVPRTWFPRDWSELLGIREQTDRQLIAKPSPSRFAPGTPAPFKALVAADVEQLARQLRRHVDGPGDILVQEFVEGDDSHIYGALAYRAADGSTLALSVRKHRQTTPGAGIMAVGQVVDLPELREMTVRLLEKIDYKGVVHTEFKRCPRDGKYYFIEWNNRPGYFHSLGWKAGFDGAWFAYCDHVCPENLASMRLRHDASHYWITFQGDLGHLLKRPGLMLRPGTWAPYFSSPEWAIFAPDDLRPWVKASQRLGEWLLGMPGRAARKALRSLSGRPKAVATP